MVSPTINILTLITITQSGVINDSCTLIFKMTVLYMKKAWILFIRKNKDKFIRCS